MKRFLTILFVAAIMSTSSSVWAQFKDEVSILPQSVASNSETRTLNIAAAAFTSHFDTSCSPGTSEDGYYFDEDSSIKTCHGTVMIPLPAETQIVSIKATIGNKTDSNGWISLKVESVNMRNGNFNGTVTGSIWESSAILGVTQESIPAYAANFTLSSNMAYSIKYEIAGEGAASEGLRFYGVSIEYKE